MGCARFYFREWLGMAWRQSVGRADFISGIIGTVVAALLPRIWPDRASTLMQDLSWQIPLGVTAALVLGRLVLAPYWIVRERDRRLAEQSQQITENDQRIQELSARVEDLESGRVTDADIEAARRELAERIDGRSMVQHLEAEHRRNLSYKLFQKDGGTNPYRIVDILSFHDADKARIRKWEPHLWRWFLENV